LVINEKDVLMQRGVWASFGELLATFRARCHMTQTSLAAALGTHRNTIGRWERGEVLPDTRGTVLELARLLRLDESETRQLLEASLTALSPHWTVPFPRNPYFTGRETILTALDARLSAKRPIGLPASVALTGLGGLGKTQVAVEYAYRHALEYSAVFWIEAESRERMLASFLIIAEVLQLPECHDVDQQQIVAAVQRWLSTHHTWLLIGDNMMDWAAMQSLLPPMRQGTLLFTTQRQALGPLAETIDLPPMRTKEGIALVLRRAKVPPTKPAEGQMPDEYAAARQLVALLGGLPLALDQAGAYIEETSCDVASYLERYEQQRHLLLDRRGTMAGDHPYSVLATFLLANQRVEREYPLAADLLHICAFLHPDAIPDELFVAQSIGPSSTPHTTITDPYQLDLALAALRNFSLIQRHPETHTFSIHRLVQTVLREEMGEDERSLRQKQAKCMLDAAFPDVTHETWHQCERLVPHVLACAALMPAHANDQDLAKVLCKTADYFRDRAQYMQAEPLYLRALSIREQSFGIDHLQVTIPLTGLAIVYDRQGKYEQAEALYLRSLRIREQALGPEHPEVAYLLTWLAILYYQKGNYEQVEELYQRALHVQEQALGVDHPEVAHPLNGLAGLYYGQGKYELAESLCQRVLHIRERSLGPDHPEVTHPLNNLAILYYEQKKYEQAEELYLRALAIREQTFGPEHPQVAGLLNNLADLYRAQGKYSEAEKFYHRALDIREQTLGSDHPQIAHPLNGLANLYGELGRNEEARPLFQRALTIREQLGPDHPELAETLQDLAAFEQRQENAREAVVLYERALAIRRRVLGDIHPKTAATRTCYLALLRELESQNEAAEGQ
jgi:tetratricopeptide (TPR) repeat protein/transcriptional regulator with XRE-family HTH domain